MKGTSSKGKRNRKTHITCRRCGKHSYNAQMGVCSSCGFGTNTKKRGFGWAKTH